jgi:hypothetical protein
VSENRSRTRPFAIASALLCIVAIVVAIALPEPARGPAVYGAGAAALGAFCAFVALARAANKGINGVLTGFTIGFFCRAALVAAGLLASGARGKLALVYVAAFFVVYAATQVIEVLFVQSSSRPHPGATR